MLVHLSRAHALVRLNRFCCSALGRPGRLVRVPAAYGEIASEKPNLP
jgi:hypothetical protein